jgi:RND family efflux transporter MFP subunit
MTKTARRMLFAGGSALLLLAGIAFASSAKKLEAKVETKPAAVAPAVQLAAVRAVRTLPHEEITGTLQPAKALQLGFEVSGRIQSVHGVRGKRVAQGQVLAQLDSEVVRAQVQQAEAALRAAEAQSAQARDTADRQGKLQRSGTVSEWQGTSSESQAKAAEAQVQVARAALAQARAMLARHTLRAPFNGTVIDAPDQIGATVAPGAPLFVVEQLDTLTLKVSVPEAAREALSVGARVHVESIAGGAQTDEPRIRAIIPSADAATRRVPVEIAVPNRDGRFTAHTLARAVLPLGDEQVAASLPSTALASAGGDHVFVVADGGAVKKLAVTVLERGAQEIVVQGLPAGSRVVDYPAIDLEDGAKVELK